MFQKVNQVLADGLLRQMSDPKSGKLVVFADSRLDAAKLSAGIELDYYRDLVRRSLVRGFGRLGVEARAFLKSFDAPRKLVALSDEKKEARKRVMAANPAATQAVQDFLEDDTPDNRRLDAEVRSGHPRLDSDGRPVRVLAGTNLAYALEERQVLRVDGNDEQRFAFEPGLGATWVVADELRGTWRPRGAGRVEVALASRKKTDILRLRPSMIPAGLRLGPPMPDDFSPAASSLHARAAFYSWGHLLRVVACDQFDVESWPSGPSGPSTAGPCTRSP